MNACRSAIALPQVLLRAFPCPKSLVNFYTQIRVAWQRDKHTQMPSFNKYNCILC